MRGGGAGRQKKKRESKKREGDLISWYMGYGLELSFGLFLLKTGANAFNKFREINVFVVEADGVDAVFAEFELNDMIDSITDGAVIADSEVLEGVNEAALHVARLRGTDGGIDETFAAALGMEEEFDRIEAYTIVGFDKAAGGGTEVFPMEMGEGAGAIAPEDAFTTDGLLAENDAHLGEIEDIAAGAGSDHDSDGIGGGELLAGDFTGTIAGFGEDLHDSHFEGFFEGAAREAFQFLAVIGFDQVFNFYDIFVKDAINAEFDLRGDIDIIQTQTKTTKGKEFQEGNGELVQKAAADLNAMFDDDFLNQVFRFFDANGAFVDDAAEELAVFDEDIALVGAVFFEAIAVFDAGFGAGLEVEFGREKEGEDLFAGPQGFGLGDGGWGEGPGVLAGD